MDESFSARDAAIAIGEARGYEASLRMRTGGITWMMWGFVLAGIWVSYGFAANAGQLASPLIANALWAPWVVAGWAATYALWRSAALTMRLDARESRKKFGRQLLANIAVVALATIGFAYAGPAASGPVAPLIIGGILTLVFGVAMRMRGPSGIVAFVSGGLILLTAASLAVAHASDNVIGLAGALVAGGSYFLGGLILTLRG